jgi:hypothetical protein
MGSTADQCITEFVCGGYTTPHKWLTAGGFISVSVFLSSRTRLLLRLLVFRRCAIRRFCGARIICRDGSLAWCRLLVPFFFFCNCGWRMSSRISRKTRDTGLIARCREDWLVCVISEEFGWDASESNFCWRFGWHPD